MDDANEHTHTMTHHYEPVDNSGDLSGGVVTNTVEYQHAHDDGSEPHFHLSSAKPVEDKPEPKPVPTPNEEAKVVGLWQDVKRDLSQL